MQQKQLMRVQTKDSLIPWMTAMLLLLLVGFFAALALLPGASLLTRLHWLDSGICAQLVTHSFAPAGLLLPLCARNTGIYLGCMVTLLFLYASGHGRAQRFPARAVGFVLLCGVAAMVVDGVNSLEVDLGMAHLYQPQNVVRLLTGLAAGLALATFGLPWLNRFCWRAYNEKRSIGSWPMLLLSLPILAACFWAVTSQSALVVYPIALLSTAGLLVAVGSLNLLLLIGIKRRDESFTGWLPLLPYLALAVFLATGELLALAQVKLLLLRLIGPVAGF